MALLKLEPAYIGWTSKVQKKKCTFFISISKLVVIGTGLQVGTTLFCYLYKDEDKRPVVLTYLDGKPKFILNNNKKDGNTYILRDGSKNSHHSFK